MIHAKLNIFRALSNALRRREWGRGETGSKPNRVRNAQNACATPPPRTRSARQSGREADHLPRLFKNPRSARRDHFLMIFAKSCVAKRCSSGRAERPADPAQGTPAGTSERPSRRVPASKHPLRAASAAASAVAVVTGLLLLASPASALSKHVFSTSFAGSGTNALSHPTDVAVDQSTGDLYVVDNGNHRVEKFTPSGEFIFMVGKEVNQTASEQHGALPAEMDLCTAASGDICQPARLIQGATTSGIQPGELANPRFVAVDNSGGIGSGDFYVASAQLESHNEPGYGQENFVTKFDSEGHLVSDWQSNGQLVLESNYSNFVGLYGPPEPGRLGSITPTGIAVDAEGSLYLTTRVNYSHFPQLDVIYRLAQFGAFTSSATLPASLEGVPNLPENHLAAASVGRLLAIQPDDAVHSIGSTGTDLGILTGLGFDRPPSALAYDHSTEASYVAEAGTLIRQYAPGCEPSATPCAVADSFGSPQLTDATGLAVDEATGAVYASDAENNQVAVFTPAPNLPDVLTGEATNEPTPTDATLTGKVNPAGAGEVTACNFEYTGQAAFEADRRNEVQEVALSGATGGTFALSFEGQSTATTGSGELNPAIPNRLSSVSTTAGAFRPGESISGEGIPPGTTITNVSLETTPNSQETGTLEIIISSLATPHGRVSLAAGLPYNASADAVQEALVALPTIGSVHLVALEPFEGTPNVSVSGPEGGPFTVEFTHRLADADLPLLSADSAGLTPSGATASVETATGGGDGWATASQVPCLNEAGQDVNTHPIPNSTNETTVHAAISALIAETTYHYRLRAANANGSLAGRDRPFVPHHVIGLATEPASGISGEAATLHGSLLGDGTDTHYYFEWGKTAAYGNNSPAPPGTDLPVPSGPSQTPLSVGLTGLEPTTTYHYRVVAENEAGQTSLGLDREFTTLANLPTISGVFADEVFADTALLRAQVNPGSGDTVYHVEFGIEECAAPTEPCQSTALPGADAGNGNAPVPAQVSLAGLQPGTLYHYRFVAENRAGQAKSVERTFVTLPTANPAKDLCPNAHVRQQTSATSLPDCRAYELASAANAGGYDVESNLVPGQAPFAGYPQADGRLLYGVHSGGIPGTDHPTNRGVDPYLATRGENGWSTEYVGVPSNDPFAIGPFSSTPSGASAGLQAFAFGGPEGCSPCFAGGYTGTPVRLPDGKLVQGMVAGQGVPTPPPSAESEGQIAKDLSADGSHFIFGSTAKFTSDGNEGGDLTIYDRNLTTEETHAVSKTPGGATITGPGIAELALSDNGSHVLIGQKVAEDAAGHPYYHLYMDVGDSADSIDLTPGTTTGVRYAGMSADGSKVFFTTKDKLLPGEDTDESADLYLAEVGQGSATLKLISTSSDGTPSNTDSCHPVANSARPHWNTVAPEEESCGVVAVGGGGGVSSANGSVYFLSPEQLESGQGTENAPNLYVARPGDGYAPQFVATLESVLTGPQPPELGRHFQGNFEPSFSDATGVAVDHATGDIYVLDIVENKVRRFDSSGNPAPFSGSASYIEGNALTGGPGGSFEESEELGFPSQLAVDSNGRLYVPNLFAGHVEVFEPSGTYAESLAVPFPTGVAIGPGSGDIYASSFFGSVDHFDPSGKLVAALPLGGFGRADVAVDSAGNLYSGKRGEPLNVYNSSGAFVKVLDPNPTHSATLDPETGEIYVDEGDRVARYDASGQRLGTVGDGVLSGSIGVAVDAGGNLYASNLAGAKVAAFGPLELSPRADTDNPLVIDSVSAPATRHTSDFQVNPDGTFAAFGSTLPLAGNGEETAGHSEVYRFDAGAGEFACVSCQPSGAAATGDSGLASNGLSLTDDGRVFFDSRDALAAGDTDHKQDVYEWEAPGTGTCQSGSLTYNNAIGACLGLISAGTSASDSSLLSVGADGTDAYFFTRDSLAPQDENGPTMKIYDAREEGGFPYVFPEVTCKASDECHGAASPTPPPIQAGSEAGTPSNFKAQAKGCKKGFLKKHGHCVKRPKGHKHNHRAGHQSGGKK
jgi:NHL repeat